MIQLFKDKTLRPSQRATGVLLQNEGLDCTGETHASQFSERQRDADVTQLRSGMRPPQASRSRPRDGISVGNASSPSTRVFETKESNVT